MFFSYEIQNAFYRATLSGAKFFSIGNSSLGKQILATHIGSKVGPQILVQASIHAREHITSLLVFRQIEYSLRNFKGIGGIYFIPIANPDGVDIALNGTKNISCIMKKELVLNLLGEKNHNLFKANANCVDLNVNFDACWGQGKQNVKNVATENFIGHKPESEIETKCLKAFLNKIKPVYTISYHCKGEVIYYKFKQKGEVLRLHKCIAKSVSEITGYPLKNARGSAGGFKDYALLKHNIPSITIEVGNDKLSHPINKNVLPKILQQNLKVPLYLLENFVKCDIMLLCNRFTKKSKKNLCKLRFWKASRQKRRVKFQLAQLSYAKKREKFLAEPSIGA